MYQLKKYGITTIDPQALIWNPWGKMCFKNSDYLKKIKSRLFQILERLILSKYHI